MIHRLLRRSLVLGLALSVLAGGHAVAAPGTDSDAVEQVAQTEVALPDAAGSDTDSSDQMSALDASASDSVEQDATGDDREGDAEGGEHVDDVMVIDPTRTVQGGVYNRPFLLGDTSASVGGYAEFNYGVETVDGVREGPGFEFQRFNLFFSSQIGSRIRFLAELEFEHGTEEIKLETAQLDFVVFRELVIRAGIILTPLGGFNQDHDAPVWNFVDRPLVSTRVIPSTLSEVGAGALGEFRVGKFGVDYQAYLTNGLTGDILDNATGRVDIPSGRSPSIFEEDNNGRPAFSGRIGFLYEGWGELGGSMYRSAYNTYNLEGEEVDERNALTMAALDWRFERGPIHIRGEFAHAWIDVPETLEKLYTSKQWGIFTDIDATILEFQMLRMDSSFGASLRGEYVDYARGEFEATGQSRGDEVAELTGALWLRFGDRRTVVRLNATRGWVYDRFGNPPAHTAALKLGVASYF